MLKVKVISLPYIFQVLYVLCFTRPRYQVSVYRTIGPLVLIMTSISLNESYYIYVFTLKSYNSICALTFMYMTFYMLDRTRTDNINTYLELFIHKL